MNTPLLLCVLAAAPLLSPPPSTVIPPASQPPAVPVIPKIDASTPAEQETKALVAATKGIEAVDAEVKATTPPHPWAGQYYQGDGAGLNITLAIAPKAGAAYKWRGSTGVYGSGAGTVSEEKGYLTVNFATQFGMAPDTAVFAPVKWGERRYLIGRENLPKFCNAVNLGDEPREKSTGVFFMRIGDENRAAKGLPEVPAEFKDYVLREPVTAKVVKVEALAEAIDGKWDSKSYKLTLDKGSAAGMRSGMAMAPKEPRAYFEFPVTDVSTDQCVVTYTWSSWQGTHLKKPDETWVLSTRRTPIPKKTTDATPVPATK